MTKNGRMIEDGATVTGDHIALVWRLRAELLA
jgi:hypothetical protein